MGRPQRVEPSEKIRPNMNEVVDLAQSGIRPCDQESRSARELLTLN